jgi:uncharacterized alkaline shock family protein YloU
MSLTTQNLYGKIVITDEAIRTIAGASAMDTFGVYGLCTRKHELHAYQMISRKTFRGGVWIDTKNNRIYIDINLILKYGVSIDAVSDSVRNAVKYNVENATGMTVECININVMGIKN